MSIKIMSQSVVGGPDGGGGSPKQKSMAEILAKQQAMSRMPQEDQQKDLA